MQLSTTRIFLALASSSLALRSPGFRDHRLSKGAILEAQQASNASLEQRSGKYNLIKSYEGKTFFKDMMFFTGTRGRSHRLYVESGVVTTPSGTARSPARRRAAPLTQ